MLFSSRDFNIILVYLTLQASTEGMQQIHSKWVTLNLSRELHLVFNGLSSDLSVPTNTRQTILKRYDTSM